MNTEETRVTITDDEPLFVELLLRALVTEPEIIVVGTAYDGEKSVQLARELRPDVVLVDIELPGEMDGIEAALIIKREMPETGVVILSAHSDRRYITSLPLEDSSGWAYILKQTVPNVAELVRAIQGTRVGMVVLDPAVLANLRPRRDSSVAKLTPRQQDVLKLIAEGRSNAAIAKRLILSEKSVETYVNCIYQRLGLSGEQEINARVRATLLFLESSEKH
ncbi:MAG TPA: response regulator transcription factor [Dehalococcoidia bacterium]|nr:response regulator transcription factor [Dehalococcoidia bacterium]